MPGPSNSDAATKRYVERMAKIFGQIADLTEDIKQIGIEAKADGQDATMLKRWARALATEKGHELAATTILQEAVGRAVDPSLFDRTQEEPETRPAPNAARH